MTSNHASTRLADRLLARLLAGEPMHDVDILDVHGHLGGWHAFYMPRPEPTSMIDVMDRVGIDRIVISSMLAIGPDTRQGNRDTVAALEAHPGRLLGHVVANPFRPGERAELASLLARPDVVGIKIHPSTHECEVDRAEYDWILDLAGERGAVVLAHSQAECPYSHPDRFAAVAARHPDVPVILAHAGVTPPGFRASVRVMSDHANLVADVCGSHITGAWIRWLVDRVGAERVLYGSDMPFIDARYAIGRVVGADLPDDSLLAMLGGNARRLLRL